MTTDEENTPSNFDSVTVYTARVKWFNNRSGYGFATVTGKDMPRNGEDIFVHHSGITVNGEQYKYLVQGEYVQFNLRSSDNERHPFQADNISGINGGPLMCETHLETKRQRDQSRNGDEGGGGGGGGGGGPPRDVSRRAREQIRARGPREGEQWFLVKRGRGERGERVDSRKRPVDGNRGRRWANRGGGGGGGGGRVADDVPDEGDGENWSGANEEEN